ncbi:MAG TPA: LLM class flavin-dependent oxidoreductase [Pseudogracilibacillus sp.]|nr:LLM class flavin-dependent oxidoreductase [Pseudogracilibacillus sp.]
MQFGIYAELQNPKEAMKPYEQVYQEILEQIEHADYRGFSTFSTLEHHWFEEFSISTNPLALFAAAAQRTKQMHFRTCSHILPIHNPMVFAGQLAMASILTDYRFEFAVSKGHAWTYPLASIPIEEAGDRYLEAIEIIESALSDGTVSYTGKYYSVQNVSVIPQLREVPQILAGGVSDQNYEIAGKRGWTALITPMVPQDKIKAHIDIYKKMCKEYGHDPSIVYVQAVYLDEDRERAIEEAKPYVEQFVRGNASPMKGSPSNKALLKHDFSYYASGLLETYANMPYETLLDEQFVWVGSPDDIREKVEQIIEEEPSITEIAIICTYAGMEHWKTIRTQELFSKHVMPYFQEDVHSN